MEKKFEVEEFYTKERFRQYCRYTYWKENWVLKVVWAAYLIFCGYEVVNGIISRYGWLILLLFVLLFLVGVFMLFFGYLPQMRRVLKKNESFYAKRRIAFFEDHLESETDKGCKEASYQNIKKIFETADSFYIIMNRGGVLLVFKDCFTLGDSAGLSSFLQSRLS